MNTMFLPCEHLPGVGSSHHIHHVHPVQVVVQAFLTALVESPRGANVQEAVRYAHAATRSPMSTALWFVLFFTVFSVVRLGLATLFFWAVLPDDDRCPNCDAPTIRIQSRGWNFLFPWFRTSYCLECRWEGLLANSKGGQVQERTVATSDSHNIRQVQPRRRVES